MRRFVSIITLAILSIGIVRTAGAADPGTKAAGFSYERYQVLAERNIYLKNRPPQPVRTTSILRETPVVPILRRMIVLTGIARRDSEFVAFFEDRTSGTTTRLRTGGAILEGIISKINLDYVDYEKNGQVNRIRLGEPVPEILSSGTSAPAPAAANGAPSPAIAPAPAYPAATPIDETRILEQMRQRRRMEVGAE